MYYIDYTCTWKGVSTIVDMKQNSDQVKWIINWILQALNKHYVRQV